MLVRTLHSAHMAKCAHVRTFRAKSAAREMPAMLKSLDLFSGLGGITHALRDYFEPAMYCDIDKWSQCVLAHHIDTGMLPPGDLYSDVRSINEVPKDVRAIVGGSPCQSVSCMGKREGMTNESKSGLFYEIMRIVDVNPHIDVLFLENVANVLNIGITEIVDALSSRKFMMSWVIRHARGHGAPHKRMRWFCLALRDGAKVPELEGFERVHAKFPVWSKETEPARVAVKPAFGCDKNYHSDWARRQSLLGNSVVPCVVRSAFEDLAERCDRWVSIRDTLGDLGKPFKTWNGTFPPHALVVTGGAMIQLPNVEQDCSNAFTPSVTLDFGGTLLSMKALPTPRAGNCRPSRLTSRALRDLGTVLCNTLESQIYVASSGLCITGDPAKRMSDALVPNTNYVEFMMGYERDWTLSAYPEGMERKTWPLDAPGIDLTSELAEEYDTSLAADETSPVDVEDIVNEVRHIESGITIEDEDL
jgi:hypothetical protein